MAEELDVPLREQNTLLVAAGYAPEYGEHAWDAPEMAPVRRAIDLVLESHLPYPALVTDGVRNIVKANAAVGVFTEGSAEHLLAEGNIFRLVLHPEGLSSRLVNPAEVRRHLLQGLRRTASASGDPRHAALLRECEAYPCPEAEDEHDPFGGVVLPVRILREGQVLSFFSTIATFGTAVDLTVAELSLETFFPADPETAEVLRSLS